MSVRRLCKSSAHEAPHVFTHRWELLKDGRVKYTCTICGEITIPSAGDELVKPVQLRPEAHRPKLLYTDQQLIDLHAEGFNDREIAERLGGVNRSWVSGRRRRLGLKTHDRKLLFTDQQLIALYERGLIDREIAEELGVSKRTTVSNRRRGLGLKAHSRRLLFTDQQLIDLHAEGLNDREKAERLGVGQSTVRVRREGLGIEPIRPHVGDHQRFLTLYEKGMTDLEIGNVLGVKAAVVCNYRKKHGFVSYRRRQLFTDQQFLDLYERGLNDPRIAEVLGVTITMRMVRKRRWKLGLKAHGHVRLFTDQQLIALHNEGLNDKEKAERLGVGEGAVSYRRRKLGLKGTRP